MIPPQGWLSSPLLIITFLCVKTDWILFDESVMWSWFIILLLDISIVITLSEYNDMGKDSLAGLYSNLMWIDPFWNWRCTAMVSKILQVGITIDL